MTGQNNGHSSKTFFGARLAEAQKEAELSNRELAYRMDIPESQLAKYKRGDVHPRWKTAERFSEVLEKPLDYFSENEAVAA